MLVNCLPAVAAWGGWGVLEELRLSSNYLTGVLPDTWATTCCLTYTLRTLDLSFNSLSGTIPSTWTRFQNLTCVSMAGSLSMCGAVPSGLPCFEANGTNIGEPALVQSLCLSDNLQSRWRLKSGSQQTWTLPST